MKRVSWLFFFIALQGVQANAHKERNTHLEVSFSSPYPESPIKKIKAVASRLWGEINASLQDAQAKDTFEQNMVYVAHDVLDLNTLCDLLVADVYARLSGVQGRGVPTDMRRALEEVDYLLRLVTSLDQNFDLAMEGHVSDQAACIKVVFNRIKMKMEQTLYASAP